MDAKRDEATHRQQKHHDDPVFAAGGPIAGSANGISFDSEDNLWIASVFGQTLTKVDPDTGEILDQLGSSDTVYFPDDVVVDPSDDTLYWTDIALGTVLKRPVGGPTQFLLPPFGLNSANPVTLSDDGSRLFAAGCYGGPPGNSLVEIDPNGSGIVKTLRSDVPGCASNGMAWRDGFLYAPQALGDSVLKINATTGDTVEVTTGYANPVGVAFDSEGALYAVSQGTGEQTSIIRSVAGVGPFNFPTLVSEWNDQLVLTSAIAGG